MKKILFIILVVAIIIPQIVMAAWWNPFSWKVWKNIGGFFNKPKEEVVCTMEAKLCPDGSYVGRQGPKCEFAECPVVKDKTSDWKTYTDEEAGFSIKYPESDKMDIEIVKEEVAVMAEGPGKPCDSKEAVDDEKSLNKGEFGGCSLFPLKVSERVLKTADRNIKTWMVLSQFEVCDVQFTNKAMFYNNGYQITISFTGPKEEIVASISDYLTTNKENCGDEKVWFDGKGANTLQNKFYNDLRNKKIVGPAGVWFDTFSDIIGTLSFTQDQAPDVKEQACIKSGGKVVKVDCYCASPAEFFNNCAVGACTCTPNPTYLRKLKACQCSKGECFDGISCVKQEL